MILRVVTIMATELTAHYIPIALWESSKKSTDQAYANAITMVGVGKISPEPGQVLCGATTGRGIAAFEVIRAEHGGVLFTVTGWG
jgi:hypothetical protein